jgi:Delta3-Delta2-enoyl-CoA isomerase
MLHLSREDAVFVLHMNAGENRLNDAFLDAFHAALDEVERASGTVLVTRGEGKFYSNGIDLTWLLGIGADGARTFVTRLEGLLARLIAFPAPTVAAVNGHAFAGGGLLALGHDFRVMRRDRGYFCLPEVDIAVPFTRGLAAIVRTRLTPQVAHEAMVTGKRYTADEALRLGIVDESVDESDVVARALAKASALCGKDAATLGAIKRNAYRDVLELLQRGTADTV